MMWNIFNVPFVHQYFFFASKMYFVVYLVRSKPGPHLYKARTLQIATSLTSVLFKYFLYILPSSQ